MAVAALLEKRPELKIDTSIFFDFSKLLSFNILWNFVLACRGIGKTYGFKKHVVKRFKEHGEQFAIIRRTRTVIDNKKMNDFWKDIEKEFPEDKLEKQGDFLLINGEPAGVFFSVKEGIKNKSIPFPSILWIAFDEFTISGLPGERYLNNEVHSFHDLINTIQRLRTYEATAKVFFFGNTFSETNPYFTEFGLKINHKKEFIVYRDKDCIICLPNSEKFQEAMRNSRYGKSIAHTNYAKHAIDNEFIIDLQGNIQKKSYKSICFFFIVFNNFTFGVWHDRSINSYVVSFDFDKSVTDFRITGTVRGYNKAEIARFKNGYQMTRNVIRDYYAGNLFFESMIVKSNFMDLMREVGC